MNQLNILIKDARLPSWNDFYAGKHHTARTTAKNTWRALVHEQLGAEPQMFDKPVRITVNAFYKGTPCDPDNVCAKLVIDGLKGKVIADDTPEYIASVTTTSAKWEENRVVIRIHEV